MSQQKQTYEGMFLVDAGNPDFQAASEPARVALERSEAEILSIRPWDERRLAYEIRGRRRGLYILAYFKAPPERLADLERDCQLDERVLRVLVLRKESLTEQEINADTPATANARRAAARRSEDAGTAQEPAASTAEPAPPAEGPNPPAQPAADATPAIEEPADATAPAEPAAPAPAEAGEPEQPAVAPRAPEGDAARPPAGDTPAAEAPAEPGSASPAP